ncbi:MAG TPA: SoxR reducing system RseC family protein [Tissierellaceae bacterium]
MEKIGIVKKVNRNIAEIEIKRVSGCGGACKSCSGCETKSHIVVVPNTLNAKVGDLVEIQGEVKSILKYTIIVYMIPFAFLIAGILLGMNILKLQNELFSFLIGLAFMALGYFIVRIIDKKVESKDDNIVRMTKIIS